MAKKKQLGFLGLEFDTLLMEVQLSKDRLKKSMDEFANILKGESSTTHEELESLAGFFSFAAKVVCLGQAFLLRLYDRLAKGGKYLHQSKTIGDDLL